FWFTDMVLDPDYNPEGAQQKFAYSINQRHKLSFSAGEWVIAENFTSTGDNTANQDTYLFIGQADWTAKWGDHWLSRVGVASYAFANQNGISTGLETFLNQNGTSAAGTNAPHFNPLIGRAEVTYNFNSAPWFQGPFPITLGAEYANNPGAENLDHQAYNVGFAIGDVKK